jgi:hypothetical protein
MSSIADEDPVNPAETVAVAKNQTSSDVTDVTSEYMGLVRYPYGAGNCYAVREIKGYNTIGYPIFSSEGPDCEMLNSCGNGNDSSASWLKFHKNSIVRRVADSQLFGSRVNTG